MVSKRKSGSENEPGPSKKRKSEDKEKSEVDTSTSKKSSKRKSKLKETAEEVQNSDVEKDLKEQEDGSDVEMDNIETLKKVDTVNYNSDVPNWPMAHMAELLRKIESILPPRDSLVFKSRAERLDWNEVAFANYSGAECRLMWDSITKRLRRFRILREMVEDAKTWICKPWTNFYRGNKTNRHPDMPRRPLSTYMIFYLKKKDKVLKENPGLEMTDLSKVIAQMYKKLSPKVKEKYNELALEQRKEYEAKLDTFYRLHPDLMPSNAKANVNHANDHIPKKPKTPFKLYCEDKLKRSEHDVDFEKNTIIERCKEQWRSMSDKKKVFWINWTLDKESKYQDELKKYIAENPEYVPSVAKSILTKEERTIRERMAGKPEKPPNSAYSLFSRLMLASEDVKTVSPKERMLLIAQQWKGCTELEKKQYGDRVKHMLEQYKLQYAEYLESLPEDKRQEELLNSQPKKKTTVPKRVKRVTTATDGTATKRAKRTTKPKPATAKITKVNNKIVSKRENNLYEGEPQPPPATPYLLFAKLYQDSYPDKQDAHEAWEKLGEEQRNFHRRTLSDLKKVYIESYENFLKSLTQEELKDYSEWKKTVKLTTEDHSVSSDNSDSDSDQDCSSNSDSEVEQKTAGIKHEIPDESSSSE